MNSSKYNLRPITNNVSSKTIEKYLRNKNLYKAFTSSGVLVDDYLENAIENEVISLDDINDFCFNSIFYGVHKCCYISKIIDIKSINPKYILERLNLSDNVDKEFINMISIPSSKDKEELISLKFGNDNNSNLNSISLIYRQLINVNIKGKEDTKYVFIPIEIDIKKTRLIIRVNPCIEGEKGADHRCSGLAEKYTDKMKQLLNCEFEEIKDTIHTNNYNTTLNLTNEFVDYVMKNRPDFKPFGLKVSSEIDKYIEKDLKIENIKEKSSLSNIYDTYSNIQTLIENIILTEFFRDDYNSIKKMSLNAYISYIKYEDGKRFLTRFRGDYYSKPIIESETFLSLRSDLKKYKKISTIQAVWYRENSKPQRVKYEICSATQLKVYFYDELNKDDYDYAIKQYEQFGQFDFARIQTLDKTYAENAM